MKKILAIILGLSLVFNSYMDIMAGPRSYSSGSSRSAPNGPSSNNKPSTSSKNYSSGSSSSSSRNAPSSKPTPSNTPTDSSKRYSSGSNNSGSSNKYSSGNYSSTPSSNNGNRASMPATFSDSPPKGGVNYDRSAAEAQKRVKSKENYARGLESKKTYTTPTGNSVSIDTNSGSYRNVANISHEAYINRDVRIHTFYSTGYVDIPYYNRPIVVYNDCYNSLFWWWLLDRSIDHQAMWAYCHKADMDIARYNDMLAKNANLEARIKALEANKTPVDPTYIPDGLTSPDLMYTDDYVNSVYNPYVVKTTPISVKIFFWILIFLLGIILLLCLNGRRAK